MQIVRTMLLLLLLPAAAAAQAGSTTDILRGRVVGEEGQPLRGALVEAWSAQSGIRRAAVTDADGRYTLLFPDGGGRYRLRVSLVGRITFEAEVARQGDEEVLVHDVQLRPQPVELESVRARAQRAAPPGRGDAGARSQGVSGELASKLPLENTDPASLAALAPGVVPVAGADAEEGTGGFSVAGQRASQNQVTLDGATFGSMLSGGAAGGQLGLPQEGMRSTQVITNTYDVARGQFSGGQVAMSTQSGTNTLQGSFSYRLGNDLLQARSGHTDWAGGFRENRFSGGVGGPLIRDRLFYNLSLSAQQRTDDLFALVPRTPAGYDMVGAHPDSVARFLDIVGRVHGVPLAGQTGAYNRSRSGLSTLARLDYNLSDRHTVSARGFASLFEMQGAFVRPLGLLENGGDLGMDSRGVVGTLTSRFSNSWINEARVSYMAQGQQMTSQADIPEGRVRIASEEAGGGTGVSTLVFGGNPVPPRATGERTLEVANEVSWLIGGSHRLKLGGLFNHTRFDQQTALARHGIFQFNSLADLEAGRATSFTRSLVDGPTLGSGWNAALYLGDTWRVTDGLQVVYGLRLEGSGFGDAPSYSENVTDAFGFAADRVPSEVHVSPRLGFSWRLSAQGQPARILRGGFGEFRGRAPYSLYAGVLDAGRQGGEALLSCVGAGSVPAADIRLFRADPSLVPTRCADGTLGNPGAGGRRNVTGFAPDFQAPRSWRGSLGYQARSGRGLSASVDATYARGVSQYGVRDLNLAGEPAFTLASEGGRPVYAPAAAIDPRSGAIPLLASRRDDRFAHAYEVHSELASEAGALTVALSGLLFRWRASFQTSYTLGYARDQSSFTFGGPLEGFARAETRGDPNRPEWAPSEMDRRHSLTAVLGLPIRRSWELSLIGRALSGVPFTPRVGGDVNGDGARNDAAFVFDPAATADPALAAGMQRLLDGAPGSAARCLRAQLGTLAARGSCRSGWSYGLDLRLAHTPQLGPLGRRLSLALDVYNAPAGLDLLLHGNDGARGWGQAFMRTDDVLLHPRGFDAGTRSFRYEVNERFGQSLGQAMGQRSPFRLQLTGRVAVGPNPQLDPLGGFLDLGFGGAATRVTMTMSADEAAGLAAGGSGVRMARPGEGPLGRGSMLDMMLPMPIDGILALRDSLGLSGDQVGRLEAIRTSLQEKLIPIRAEIGPALQGAAGAPTDNPAALFERVGPKLNQGRQFIQQALEEAREVLTAEQWEMLPASIREAVQRSSIQIRGS